MDKTVDWSSVPIILNTEELKKLLGFNGGTLYRMIRDKKIPAKKINKEWRFLKEEIQEWLQLK